jgi:hypothetical protein
MGETEKILLTSNGSTALYCNVLTKFELKAKIMKTKLWLVLAFSAVFGACGKDTYTTKPSLSFKDVNGTVFGNGSTLIFNIEFTDKEGDIQDSIWVQKITRTKGCTNFSDRTKIPSFQAISNLKGTFEVGYSVGTSLNSTYPILPGCPGNKNDTCYFKFWARDLAKNVSDTVVSPDIIILK